MPFELKHLLKGKPKTALDTPSTSSKDKGKSKELAGAGFDAQAAALVPDAGDKTKGKPAPKHGPGSGPENAAPKVSPLERQKLAAKDVAGSTRQVRGAAENLTNWLPRAITEYKAKDADQAAEDKKAKTKTAKSEVTPKLRAALSAAKGVISAQTKFESAYKKYEKEGDRHKLQQATNDFLTACGKLQEAIYGHKNADDSCTAAGFMAHPLADTSFIGGRTMTSEEKQSGNDFRKGEETDIDYSKQMSAKRGPDRTGIVTFEAVRAKATEWVVAYSGYVQSMYALG